VRKVLAGLGERQFTSGSSQKGMGSRVSDYPPRKKQMRRKEAGGGKTPSGQTVREGNVKRKVFHRGGTDTLPEWGNQQQKKSTKERGKEERNGPYQT